MKNISNKKNIFKKVVIFVMTILVFIVSYLFLFESKYNGSIEPTDETLVFAHRGYGNHAPDNSLVAAKLAIKNGMDGVDVDAQLSADKKLMVFHDLSVDRLTSGTGKVKDMTAEELLKLDLAEKYGGEFNYAPVATFENFVQEITPNGFLMVELKVPGSKPTGIEEEAVRIIQKHNAHDRVYLSSFNPLTLYRLKKLDPNIKTVFIFMDTNWNQELLKEIDNEDLVNLPWFLRQEAIRRGIRNIIKPDALSINNEVDESVIDQMIDKGYPVFIWTIDEDERIRWALEKKPYGVISDEPILTKQLRDENNAKNQ